MTSFIVLTIWSAVGLSLAVWMSAPSEARFAWTPVALDHEKIAADVESQQLR